MKENAEATGLAFDQQYVGALAADPRGPRHESRVFPYTLFRPHSRPIGEGDRSHESVHADARKRYEEDRSYRPEKLVSYFRKQPSA